MSIKFYKVIGFNGGKQMTDAGLTETAANNLRIVWIARGYRMVEVKSYTENR
jgi:hypothetical protein